MKFKIEIARRVIEIESIFDNIYIVCKDYLTDKEPVQYHITVTRQDIENEMLLSKKVDERLNQPMHLRYAKALENTFVYRRICEMLMDEHILLMHGSVVGIDNRAVMLSAVHGIGKTTQANLWLDNIEGTYILNGDKPLLIIDDKQILACGTPWCGKEHNNKNKIIPLVSICFIQRGEINNISEVTFEEIFPKLVEQSFKPETSELKRKNLYLLLELKNKVKFYKMTCNRESEAAEIAYNYMLKRENAKIPLSVSSIADKG